MLEIRHGQTAAVLLALDGDTLAGRSLARGRLAYAALNGADLTRSDLRGADLCIAHLEGADSKARS